MIVSYASFLNVFILIHRWVSYLGSVRIIFEKSVAFKNQISNLKYTDNTSDRILEADLGRLGHRVLIWKIVLKFLIQCILG